MHIRPRLSYSNVVATACLVALVGGTAVAATKKPAAKTISACVVKKGKAKGAMRMASGKAKCRKTEKKYTWNKAGIAGVDATAPAGQVAFFNLPTCPAGWQAFSGAAGRYLVGLQPGGTLAKTDGTPLTDGEDRPTGKHTHTVTDPGHSHTVVADPILDGGNVAVQRFQGTADNQSGFVQQQLTTNSAFTGITVNAAGSVDGTNAPYIQLLACQKS